MNLRDSMTKAKKRKKTAKVIPPDSREVAAKKGIKLGTVYSRLSKGWTMEEALNPETVRRELNLICYNGNRDSKPAHFHPFNGDTIRAEEYCSDMGITKASFIASCLRYVLNNYTPEQFKSICEDQNQN